MAELITDGLLYLSFSGNVSGRSLKMTTSDISSSHAIDRRWLTSRLRTASLKDPERQAPERPFRYSRRHMLKSSVQEPGTAGPSVRSEVRFQLCLAFCSRRRQGRNGVWQAFSMRCPHPLPFGPYGPPFPKASEWSRGRSYRRPRSECFPCSFPSMLHRQTGLDREHPAPHTRQRNACATA